MKKIKSINFYEVFVFSTTLLFLLDFTFTTYRSSLNFESPIWKIAVLIISLLALVGMLHEFHSAQKSAISSITYSFNDVIATIGIISATTVATYYTTLTFDVTSIFSASMICVLCAYLLPNRFEGSVYSGSVAGMIGAYFTSHWLIALLVGVMTSLAYFLFQPSFRGVGGRGGAIPFMGTLFVVRLFLFKTPHTVVPIEKDLLFPSLVVMLGAALLTYFLHQQNILTIVKAAMIVALMIEIILPIYLYTLVTAGFAGTIVGMSSTKKIENVLHLILITLVCFILFVPAYHMLDGIGGKLGMMCVIGYIAMDGMRVIVNYIKEKNAEELA